MMSVVGGLDTRSYKDCGRDSLQESFEVTAEPSLSFILFDEVSEENTS